jgi:oligoendopeptidase F
MQDRSKIDNKYKWDLSAIVPSDIDWEKRLDKFVIDYKQLSKYDGKLGDKSSLKMCLDLLQTLSCEFEKLYTYARMHKDEDSKIDKYVGYADKASTLMAEFGAASSYISPQLSSLSQDYLKDIIADKDFGDYDFMISNIIRNKAHILSDKEEKLIASYGGVTASFQKIHGAMDNADVEYGTIEIDGQPTKLSHGVYSLALQHPDRKVRKAAFESFYSSYHKFINIIANNYAGKVKTNVLLAQVRGFDNAAAAELHSEGIPQAVYDSLIDAVHQGQPLMHKYIAHRKSVMDGEQNMYDLYVPLFKDAGLKLEYPEAYQLVVDALRPLGQEYHDLLVQARDGGWIDVYETPNKRSGAYSWGAYGVHPYVLLNYTATTHDVFTIAHELGHAMHSYYSDKSLPCIKAGYSIFVAEVASTVNEVLLIKHLNKTSKDINLLNFLNQYYLDMIRTTIFRQTMFSEFEKNAHNMEQQGKPLTVQSLSSMYLQLNKEYYGESVVHNKEIEYEWMRIPHFYNSFYVYKYATGLTTAIAFADKILKGDTTSYFAFLKSGGSKLPYDIIKDAGVDLATIDPYKTVLSEFEKTLELLQSSIK